MLNKRRQLPELFYLKNFYNDQNDDVDFENKILKSNLSSYIFNNEMMSGFLERLQPLLSMMFDRMNIIKNFKNFIVDKYER